MTDQPAEPASLPAITSMDGQPVLALPAAMRIDALCAYVREGAEALAAKLGGRGLRLDLTARSLELFEVRKVLQTLREPYGIEVTGLVLSTQNVHDYVEREFKRAIFYRDTPAPTPQATEASEAPALPGLEELRALLAGDAPKDTPPPAEAPAVEDSEASGSDELEEIEVDEVVLSARDEAIAQMSEGDDAPESFTPALRRRPIPVPDLADLQAQPVEDPHGGRPTLTLRRTLRSGTEIHYDHDVVILGDVNAGASIRAGGSVIVLGHLRGVAHAGAPSRDDAFVLALSLDTTQLRIGKHIAITPKRAASTAPIAEIAVVRGDEVLIEPYKGRWPR